MNNLLFTLIGLTISLNVFCYDVSGIATDSETGDPLSGFDILLTYTSGGIVASAVTQSDGSFTLIDVPDGTYNLEFYNYPDPTIINGNYYLLTTMEEPVTVNGANVTGIEFMIPPHHPDFTLTGTLYDAVTNQPIVEHDFQVQMKMHYYPEFFYDWNSDDGNYVIGDLPDWTYDLTVFENDYYEQEMVEVTIDPMGPDTVVMDFYLQPKSGATVSGVLLDSATNEPIMQAGRTIEIQAINSFFTETNDQGEFTFVNVPPDTYANINVATQDTDYVNCSGSKITGFTVPSGGLDDVQLYQKPWVSLHEITADANTFDPGETKTIEFSIVNDDLSYGSIWGVNLIFPEGVSVVSTTPFYSDDNGDVIFDKLPDCSTEDIKAWEGWHWVGIPPYASSEGNLDVLNESAWSDVTLGFADSASMEMAPVFYEIYYDLHCNTIQPFSYGTIMMINDNITSDHESFAAEKNIIEAVPNPAGQRATFLINLDKRRHAEIAIHNMSGQAVMTVDRIFEAGTTQIPVNISRLKNGMYFYTLIADDLKLDGKLIISY